MLRVVQKPHAENIIEGYLLAWKQLIQKALPTNNKEENSKNSKEGKQEKNCCVQ